MSSKSAQKVFNKNPYGNSSRRGRSWSLLLTVVILIVATGVWTMTYTRSIGASTDVKNTNPPVAKKVPLVNQ